jgi:hypothetical protein
LLYRLGTLCGCLAASEGLVFFKKHCFGSRLVGVRTSRHSKRRLLLGISSSLGAALKAAGAVLLAKKLLGALESNLSFTPHKMLDSCATSAFYCPF